MWANAEPDGRPAEHRWRPLFNAAKLLVGLVFSRTETVSVKARRVAYGTRTIPSLKIYGPDYFYNNFVSIFCQFSS